MSSKMTQKDFSFSVERGVTWGTAIHSSPVGLPTSEMEITLEPSVHNSERCQGLRGDSEKDFFIDNNGAIPTASVSFPMTPQLLELMLPGVLQSDPDYSAAANIYTMQTNNYDALPTPKGDNSGYFYTLARNRPDGEGALDKRIASAVPTSLKLSTSPLDNEGLLWAEMDFVGKTFTRNDNVASGDIVQAELTHRFEFTDITGFKWDSEGDPIDLTTNLTAFEVNITNGAKFIGDVPLAEIAFPKWDVEGEFTVMASGIAGTGTDAMQDLVYSADINTGKTLELTFNAGGTPVADGDLEFKFFCYLTSESANFDEAEAVTFGFKGLFGSVAADEFPVEAVFYKS